MHFQIKDEEFLENLMKFGKTLAMSLKKNLIVNLYIIKKYLKAEKKIKQ